MNYKLIKISKSKNDSNIITGDNKLAIIKELSQINGISIENTNNKFSIIIRDNIPYLKSLYKDFKYGVKDLEKTYESHFILDDKPIFEKIIRLEELYTGTLNGLLFKDINNEKYSYDTGIATFLRTNEKGEKWYIVDIDDNYNFGY